MALSEMEIRGLWEKQLGRLLSDANFEAMRAVWLGADEVDLCFSTPRDALDALALVVGIVRGISDHPKRDSVSLQPPRGWHRYQEKLFEARFGREVVDLRESLGLSDRLLKPADVPAFLRDKAMSGLSKKAFLSLERDFVGQWLAFWDSGTDDVENVVVFTGEEIGLLAVTAEFMGDPQVDFRAAMRAHGALLHLQHLSDHMALLTGISELWAVDYILCGGLPDAPWVEAYAVPRGDEYEDMIRIEIGSLDVKPDEVAAAYSRARQNSLSQRETQVLWAFKRATPSAEDVISFCRPKRTTRPPMAWKDIVELWNAKHPDRAYKNGDALSRVYRRHIDTLRGGETK